MNDAVAPGEKEYELPCVEALFAGTLALMTAHTQTSCLNRRKAMEEKIIANLSWLTQLPAVTAAFRAAILHVSRHWQVMHDVSVSVSISKDCRLWHASPASPQ